MTALVAPVSREDIKELVNGALPLTPAERYAFNAALRLTHQVWVGKWDGQVVCIWGLMPGTICDPSAYLWLYTTPAIKDCEFTFVRQSQIAVREMLKSYALIRGHCQALAEHSIRWVRWLGGEFGDPAAGFVPFTIARKDG